MTPGTVRACEAPSRCRRRPPRVRRRLRRLRRGRQLHAARHRLGGGEQLFKDNCSSCHTLAAAGASGKVGPDLDQLKPGPDLVTSQVNNGGGAMPSFKGKLTDDADQADRGLRLGERRQVLAAGAASSGAAPADG